MKGELAVMKQGGFTLIEMMAALLISSVLLLAMYQNFIVTQRTYQLVEGNSLMQENARFSSDILARTVRSTGYRQSPGTGMATVFPVVNPAVAVQANMLAAGQVVAGFDNAAGILNVKGGTDTITVRYQAGVGDTDCLGNPATPGNIVINYFYVFNNGNPNNISNDSLMCGAQEIGPGGGAAAPQPLVSGVEDFQVLYGIDTDTDLVVDTYLNASAMTPADWGKVVTVRISALYTTVNRVPTATRQVFTLLDKPQLVFNDGLRRQLFNATIRVRNLAL